PGRADRVPGVLPGRDRDGVRVSQGGAGGAGRGRADQVPPARRGEHALPVGAGLDVRAGRAGDARAGGGRVADVRAEEGVRRVRPQVRAFTAGMTSVASSSTCSPGSGPWGAKFSAVEPRLTR